MLDFCVPKGCMHLVQPPCEVAALYSALYDVHIHRSCLTCLVLHLRVLQLPERVHHDLHVPVPGQHDDSKVRLATDNMLHDAHTSFG
jgi:hypothetical protein